MSKDQQTLKELERLAYRYLKLNKIKVGNVATIDTDDLCIVYYDYNQLIVSLGERAVLYSTRTNTRTGRVDEDTYKAIKILYQHLVLDELIRD